MNKKFAATSPFLLVLLVFSAAGTVFGQNTALPGVSVGDTFTYSSTYLWTSSNPADVVPASLVAQNESTLQITVQAVVGSTVTIDNQWTYKNGTKLPVTTELDEVNSHITPNDILVYAGNLSAGGFLFPGATDLSIIINETIFRNYGGVFRDTNHMETNRTDLQDTVYSYLSLYFDKQTGMTVEYNWITVYTATPNQILTQHLVLTDTNVWAVSTSPLPSSPSTTTSTTVNPSMTANPSVTPSSEETTPAPSTIEFSTELILAVIIIVVIVVVATMVLLKRPKPKAPETT